MGIERAQGTRLAKALVDNVGRVIIGKQPLVTRAVCALLAEGHVLLEDVPGVGKTMLAKALARSIDGRFQRIQFTADLLPSDVTGVNIFDPQKGEFTFRPGPLFANVLLGDEINRATPRTQSSLLEAMEEVQVTVDGERRDLTRPFLVIATQNPIELEGTYPLPFAQMDRFIVRLGLGYLDAADEAEMLRSRVRRSPIDDLESVLNCDELVDIQRHVEAVTVAEALFDYIVAIVRATRESPVLEYGASPRATLDLMRYSQAWALLNDRDYVLPDDVKQSATVVMAHRVIIRKGTRHATLNADEVIAELVENVAVPV